jgi:Fe2+ or Zn2+ uptake regulation protein
MNIETTRPDSRNSPMAGTNKPENFPSLTRNQKMVHGALLGLGRAAKAYELLDMLRPEGVKAAPTVYRALHELKDKGLVQHMVSSRTFFAHKQPALTTEQSIALLCNACGKTQFFESEPLLTALSINARKVDFTVHSYHLEIETSCTNCNERSLS